MNEIKTKDFKIFETEVQSHEPPVDIYETEDFLVVDIDLPGIDPDNVLIKVVENNIIIEGIRTRKTKEGTRMSGESIKFLCMERRREAFRRILKIPVEVEPEQGKAVYNNGVVSLSFPKLKSKVIKIKLAAE